MYQCLSFDLVECGERRYFAALESNFTAEYNNVMAIISPMAVGSAPPITNLNQAQQQHPVQEYGGRGGYYALSVVSDL